MPNWQVRTTSIRSMQKYVGTVTTREVSNSQREHS